MAHCITGSAVAAVRTTASIYIISLRGHTVLTRLPGSCPRNLPVYTKHCALPLSQPGLCWYARAAATHACKLGAACDAHVHARPACSFQPCMHAACGALHHRGAIAGGDSESRDSGRTTLQAWAAASSLVPARRRLAWMAPCCSSRCSGALLLQPHGAARGAG